MPTPLRRLAAGFTAVAAASLLLATPLIAATDTGGGGGGGGGPIVINKAVALTVTPPARGKITGAGIDCGAGATDCSDSAHYVCTDGDCGTPVTTTLSASGAGSGWDSTWSGCTAVNGTGPGKTCDVTLDEDRTVGISWADSANPVVVLTGPPAKSGSVINASANATDNDAIKRVEFFVDGAFQGSDTIAPYAVAIPTGGYAHGSTHTVTAKAFDNADRFSVTGDRTTTIDKLAAVTLGSSPAAGAYLQSASLAFTIDSDMTAQCRAVRSGEAAPAFSTCGSPFAPALADGAYTFEVRGTDDAGNTQTASRSFTLDTTQPAVAFADGPPEGSSVGSSTFTYTFSASDSSPLTVECALDSGAYGACSSPTGHTLSGVPAGSHAFRVRARDAAGNERVILRNFAVSQPGSNGSNGTNGTNGTNGGNANQAADTLAPTVKLAANAKQKLKSKALALSFDSNEGGVASAKATYGKLSVGTLSKTVTAGKTKLKLKLSKKAQKALAKALKKKKSVSIKVAVTVRDLAGNAQAVTKTIKLTR